MERPKTKTRGGFSSVYLVVILSAFMALVLAVIEAAAGFAAGSIAENQCLIAGRSVLSEYQPQLYDRYGVLAMRSDEHRLSDLTMFYLTQAQIMSTGLVKISPVSVEADSSAFSGEDISQLEDQIVQISGYMAVKSALDETGLSKLIEDIISGKAAENYDGEGVEEELDELAKKPEKEPDDPEEAGSFIERRKQAVELRRSYRNAFRTYGRPKKGNMVERLAGYVKDDLFAVNYSMRVCSNRAAPMSDTVLRYESEYLLFGGRSDPVNEKAMKTALFAFRFAVDLAGILSDSAEMASIHAAALSFFLLPEPLVVAVLVAVRAARLASQQTDAILAGESVPIVSGLKFGKYEDYLALFLCSVPKSVLLSRLMTLMEQNVQIEDKADFSFAEYCYGYELRAEFSKRTHLPDFLGITRRKSVIEQVHGYV
jgi:hypothetical protein